MLPHIVAQSLLQGRFIDLNKQSCSILHPEVFVLCKGKRTPVQHRCLLNFLAVSFEVHSIK